MLKAHRLIERFAGVRQPRTALQEAQGHHRGISASDSTASDARSDGPKPITSAL